MSAQNGEESTQTSDKTLMVLTEISEKLFPSLSPEFLIAGGYIRTAGHFTEYFILGLLAFNCIRLFRRTVLKSFILSVLLCLMYAVSDEFHQLFVDGRACELSDLLVDLAGSGLACVLYFIAVCIKNKIKKPAE